MRWRLVLIALFAGLAPTAVRADIKPHALCADGMVLQQKAKVKVWGTSAPSEKVNVQFRGQTSQATADDKGQWIVALDSGDAGGPFPMTLQGINKLEYKNVLVGEVWLCSGQSNMEWRVSQCDKTDREAATSAPANPMLRMFTVKKNVQTSPVADAEGAWIEAKPETVEGFSSVGYFFGRSLNENLKVPVGLINSSWGGTRAEAWTRKELLDADADHKHEHPNFTKNLEAFQKSPKEVKNPVGPNSPSVLYNGMIRPVLNATIKGAIWYQGESNVGKAHYYRKLFPMMIENWRQDFQQGDFPFYFVQLAPFLAVQKEPGESGWAELREAQSQTLKLKNTGQAVITDFGHETDIHPTPKRPAGERLALIARARDYGQKIEYSGPVFKSMKVEGSKAVLSFDHVGGGLIAQELKAIKKEGDKGGPYWRVDPSVKNAALVGFTIAGEDKKFHHAKAEISGDTVIVSSPNVQAPVAVRYGWANHPVSNLFNKEGLPASPFRTDSYPGVTGPK